MSDSAASLTRDELCRELEALWRERIPLTRALGVALRRFDDATLELAADLAPNVNIHGTGFAGSLYSISALCGWSMIHLQLGLRGLAGSIVLAEGRIRYLRPVTEEIVAVCLFDDHDAAFTELAHSGRARFPLTAKIASAGKVAVEFEGDFAVKSQA